MPPESADVKLSSSLVDPCLTTALSSCGAAATAPVLAPLGGLQGAAAELQPPAGSSSGACCVAAACLAGRPCEVQAPQDHAAPMLLQCPAAAAVTAAAADTPLPSKVVVRQGNGNASTSSLDSLSSVCAPTTPDCDREQLAVAAQLAFAAELADAAELAPDEQKPTKQYAYVTLLTREGYLMGVQALARSLQAVGSRRPLLVMYTADTLPLRAVHALEREPGCEPVAVQRYLPPGPHHNFAGYKLPLYAECWTKLRLWELGRYERLVYLDADMILLHNIDGLFDLPAGFYAAPDCTAGRKTREEQDACPLFCAGRPHYFNAGFFVVSPSAAELASFDALLAEGKVPIGGYAEQDFLNVYYKDSWRPLPHTFNAQKGIKLHHPQLWQQHWGDVAILHYTDAKPWQRDHPEHEQHLELVELWWQTYERRW